MKDGRKHLESLRDGRQSSSMARCVEDQTEHPAFRNAVRSAAALFDYQAQPANLERMTFVSPTSGERVNRMWQLPTSHAELVERRQALESWAELTCGMLGRSPDHVASCVSGMYMGLDLFERHDPRRAAAVRDYYEYARDNDLYLTYVIISPQADRGKGAGEQSDEFLVAGVCDEDREGITIRGAKMLGTGLPDRQRGVRRRHPAAQAGRGEAQLHGHGAAQCQGAEDPVAQVVRSARAVEVRQPAVFVVRRERRGAVFRRGQGAVGAGVRAQRRADGAGAVARDSDPRLPELPVPDPPDGEAALPARPRQEDRRDQRHRQFPAGARNAGPARRRGRDGRGHGRRHGGQPAGTTASTSCRTSGCCIRRWC